MPASEQSPLARLVMVMVVLAVLGSVGGVILTSIVKMPAQEHTILAPKNLDDRELLIFIGQLANNPNLGEPYDEQSLRLHLEAINKEKEYLSQERKDRMQFTGNVFP